MTRVEYVINTIAPYETDGIKNNASEWFDGEIAEKIHTRDKLQNDDDDDDDDDNNNSDNNDDDDDDDDDNNNNNKSKKMYVDEETYKRGPQLSSKFNSKKERNIP